MSSLRAWSFVCEGQSQAPQELWFKLRCRRWLHTEGKNIAILGLTMYPHYSLVDPSIWWESWNAISDSVVLNSGCQSCLYSQTSLLPVSSHPVWIPRQQLRFAYLNSTFLCLYILTSTFTCQAVAMQLRSTLSLGMKPLKSPSRIFYLILYF